MDVSTKIRLCFHYTLADSGLFYAKRILICHFTLYVLIVAVVSVALNLICGFLLANGINTNDRKIGI